MDENEVKNVERIVVERERLRVENEKLSDRNDQLVKNWEFMVQNALQEKCVHCLVATSNLLYAVAKVDPWVGKLLRRYDPSGSPELKGDPR